MKITLNDNERWLGLLQEGVRDPRGPNETFVPGERVWFEYHCDESDGSSDSHLRDRSHQMVTIVKIDGKVLASTQQERFSGAVPVGYKIKFKDGLIDGAFEDELSYDRSGWYRPDPPLNRDSGMGPKWYWNGKKMVKKSKGKRV